MARKTDDTAHVTNLVSQFHRLMDACDSSRSQWREDAKENFGFYMSDSKVVFGANALTREQKRAVGAPAQYHFPLVTEKVESLVAALNGEDLMLRYLPNIEQDSEKLPEGYTVDALARMGNAALEASKNLVDWHRHMHLMVKDAAIFDSHYIGVCVDYVKRFPDPMADLVAYTPWQVFSTPGVRFEEASEVVVSKWVNKSELKAQYRELASDIDDLPGFEGKEQDGTTATNLDKAGIYGGKGGIPGYGNQYAVVDGNCIQVLERWKLDTRLVETSKKEDQATIDAERGLIDDYVDGKIAATPEFQSGKLYFDEYQHHSMHITDHVEQLDELNGRLAETTAVPDMYGTMMQVPAIQDSVMRGRLEQAVQVLTEHARLTNDAMDAIPPEKEGMRPKYDGGWRQTCIIGDKILAFDDASLFYTEYGIQGVPIWEFELMGHPLYHKGPSYVRLLVDHNKILNSTINQLIDNGRLFSNISWWAKEKVFDDLEINNDPRKPIKISDDAQIGVDFGLFPAQELPSSLFQLIGLDLSLAQSASAINPAMQGSKESGVRSGTQQQSMVQQNVGQLMYKMTRLKPSLEKLGAAYFKMVLMIPPDDAWVKPILQNEMVKIDWEVLRKIDFVIDVVVKPGGLASAEERQQIILGFLQNFGPLLAQIGMIDVNLEFLAEGIKYSMPDMAQVIRQNVEKIRQAQAQQQQQQQAMMQQEQQMQQQQAGQQGQQAQMQGQQQAQMAQQGMAIKGAQAKQAMQMKAAQGAQDMQMKAASDAQKLQMQEAIHMQKLRMAGSGNRNAS